MNHGLIERKTGTPPPPPFIPVFLLNVRPMILNLTGSEAIGKYGKWEMKAVRDVWVAGTNVQAGDTFECPGNTAWLLATSGEAVFVNSEKYEKEQRILEEAERIKNTPPVRVKDMPEKFRSQF